MSVIKNKRSTSGVQFLDTAEELDVFTTQKCAKFPKSYRQFGINATAKSAEDMAILVKRGNSIFPTSADNIKLRHEQFMLAGAELQVLISRIHKLRKLFPIAESTMIMWMELIKTESQLLKGVIKKEKEKYKF